MTGSRPRLAIPAHLAALVGVLGLVVPLALWWTGRGDGRTHIIVPELAGDGILVKDADGSMALIDGGADGAAVATWLGRELPLARRRIDLLLLTRADETTLLGQLAVARRYEVGQAILAKPADASPLWNDLVEVLVKGGARVELLRDRRRVRLGAASHSVELEIQPVDGGRMLVDARIGSERVLLLHSLGTSKLPASIAGGPVAAIVFPWRRAPEEVTSAGLTPQAIIYSDERQRDPQLSLWDRRVGNALLLHEQLYGRIDLSFDDAGMRVAVERDYGN